MDLHIMEIVIYVIAGGGILYAVALFKSELKTKKCSVCITDCKDLYRDESDRGVSLCRNHLVERWKNDVVSSPFDMVIIEPDFINYPYGYPYATIPRLKEWFYPKEAQDKVSSFLDSISGKSCNECANVSASVAFFNKEDFPVPNLESIIAEPAYLCKKCAVKKVEPLIINSPKDFIEGLYAPTHDRVIYNVQGW